MDEFSQLIIGIIGGTGKEGKGLAYSWAKKGIKIIIGSRNKEKADIAANEVNLKLKNDNQVIGEENHIAAQKADLVVLTVPYNAHAAMCRELAQYLRGKIVIDVTVPLVPPKVSKVQMPPAGSATQEAQEILGAEVKVVAAFQNISYENLMEDTDVDCDVIVCGGNREARDVVIKLVEKTGLKGWDGGPIENAVVVEGLTSILIGINKRYGSKSAGIRITGINKE